MYRTIRIIIIALCCTQAAFSQSNLFIDTDISAEEMIMDFFDNSCVTPSNVMYTGSLLSKGYFEGALTDLNINAGILLCSGHAAGAIGPNNSGLFGTNVGGPSDPDLSNYSGETTFDASILEMDIVSTGDTLCFQYAFGSEEYPEFVGSGFNDVFAFLVSGPGLMDTINIATIPGSGGQPVAINSVNQDSFSQFYVDNTNGQHIQYDGFTTPLLAKVVVIPGQTYHVKLAVADASDAIFDSGVFIGIESLCGDSLLTPPAQFIATVTDSGLIVDNTSKYATSYMWDFGDGYITNEKNPGIHAYAQPGNYTVTLITQNYCCSDTFAYDVEIEPVVSVADIPAGVFSVYPNPITDHVFVESEETLSGMLEIYNAAGKLLLHKKDIANQKISFAQYESGVYVLKIKTSGGVYVQKILKL